MNVRIYQRITGGPWWIAYPDPSGKYVRKSLGTKDYSKAERLACSYTMDVADEQPIVGEDATVAMVIENFLKQPYTQRPRTRQRMEQVLNRVSADLGEMKITNRGFRAAVKAYRAARVNQGKSVRTANYEVQALHQVITWALDFYPGLVDPLAGLKRLKQPHRESRFLTPQEVKKLLGSLRSPEDFLRVGIFLYTGMRRAEGINLWWSHVKRRKGIISIEPHAGFTPKNGEARVVPICDELAAILKKAPRRGKHVLTTLDGRPFLADQGNSLLRWMQRAYKRAGIKLTKGLGVHTLRHTYCSHLARMNVRAELRAKLVGHRELAMQNIYTHTLEEDALEAGRGLKYA